MSTTYNIRFQIAGHNAANWSSANPVLLDREFAVEKDTGKFKIGDGSTAWNSLPYIINPVGEPVTETDDTNVTITLGGSAATGAVNPFSIALGWTGLLASSRGGTGNGFTKFSGPATSEKTFTLPNANETIATLGQVQTFTGAQTFSAQISAAVISSSSYVAAAGGFQATGTRTYAGAGVGLQYTGGAGFIQSFDHGAATWKDLTIGGLIINLGPSGTNAFIVSSAGAITTVNVYTRQGSGNAVNATATLTIAQLLGGLIFTTSAVAVSLTLPTGTLTDAGVVANLANDRKFEWGIINLGSAAGAITILTDTGHTFIGNATIAIGTSAQFWTRKTAANTFVTYRVG